MQNFTPYQYLQIDVANQFGLDKKTFDERLAWVSTNINELEKQGAEKGEWKERPLYIKSVSALRKAQAGEKTGHRVSFDAICSGMQIMSALMNCKSGCAATGLIHQDERPDAYTKIVEIMEQLLGYKLQNVGRVKNATMTSLYGSKKEPEKEFGEGTAELDAFYRALYQLCPGACDLLEMLVGSWKPYALTHEWVLPDGFYCKIKTIQMEQTKIEVDELNSHTFTYQYAVNKGEKKGVKNAANIVHSIDAYVLRSLIRRCSYDKKVVNYSYNIIVDELMERLLGNNEELDCYTDKEIEYYGEHYVNSQMADPIILPYLDSISVKACSTEHLTKLRFMLDTMIEHEPFDVITVHDDFSAHANNVEQLRKHYNHIIADLADSTLIEDILGQIYGYQDDIAKLNPGISVDIRNANYALS